MVKLILGGLVVAALMFFLSIADRIFLLFFQEDIADRYATYPAIPFLLYFFIYFIRDGIRYPLREGRGRVIYTIKETVKGMVIVGLLYYFVFFPVLSGIITMTNAWFGGDNKKVMISGIVEDVYAPDIKGADGEVVVYANDRFLIFDTTRFNARKYKKGDAFVMEMQKGAWGLLYQWQ